MRLIITGLWILLLLTSAAIAGDCKSGCKSSCKADHGCSCGEPSHKPACDAPSACCCTKQPACECKPDLCPCSNVKVEAEGCIPLPFTDEGCWLIDPSCCERDEFRLLCPQRGEFELLCRPKCAQGCKKPKKCKQDTCETCVKDAEPFEE